MIYIFFANGFEDVEALIPLDVLRRAGKDVVTVSLNETKEVESAHGVTIIADTLFADNDYEGAELLFLPGGMPGATNLANHKGLCEVLVKQNDKGGRIAAICASPAVVLSGLGVLKGKQATCYPGFEGMLADATYTGELFVTDGNITTGEGPAAAFPFAYELATLVAGKDVSDQLAEGMRFKHLMNM
ncbi:MAG: DJ-1/PfpI family protein [Bacteroidaceae bacterium]|nr:DJ-1/PfpI family protein [Bacteroidaceae bacterium]